MIIEPTSTLVYLHGHNFVLAQTCQTDAGFLRRLVVNGDPSPWKACYTGILVHCDFAWADDNDETLPDEPFHIALMVEQKTILDYKRHMILVNTEGRSN